MRGLASLLIQHSLYAIEPFVQRAYFKPAEKSKITSVDNKKIPKVQWVSENVLVKILMPEGKWKKGLAEVSVSKLKKGDIVQFERFGFVKYDRDHEDAREFWFAHM